MSYTVDFTKSAARTYRKLPQETRERIIAALERSRIRPEQHFEKLVGSDAYTLRGDSYRIIADTTHERLLILVLTLDHRKKIYKR
ncbi:MAG: type II toxin-antitoxin system RelE family toxin [Candidatus Woesearchaeota archaeon]